MNDRSQELYRNLKFLVIDDQPNARQSLRICAQTMGAFAVEFSSGYQDAIVRIRRSTPDVILCDYLLGNDRSGQQLLEELRRYELLPDETVFMMVTAEQSYEQVVAAVELVPDDYIIKPFSPDRLKFRLDRALQRKRFFRPLYQAKRNADFDSAERFVAAHRNSEAGQPYRFELLRQNAELQLAKGDPVAAQTAFDEILGLHPFPWARAGKAKSLQRQNRFQEARTIVEEVIESSPMYFDAFDLKTRICMDMGDYEEAQRTVQDISARTGRNYVRKRLLADAALLNGDAETARSTMEDVLQNDIVHGEPSISDRLMLVRSHLDSGDSFAAELALRKISAQSLETATLDEKTSHLALRAILSPDEARARFGALRQSIETAGLGATAQVDVIRAALILDEQELATRVTAALFSSDEIRRVFKQVRTLFESHGLESVFRDLQKQAALQKIRQAPRS
ncbi:MAG: response regulator [Rhodocyclaceae bacterium]|jgi:DNA-binding response OmpR family regulator|nr:response regulator [Rhodocyclaceae bacterium]MCL4757269.1 response regulator [Rhodocyclaceae bacterium]